MGWIRKLTRQRQENRWYRSGNYLSAKTDKGISLCYKTDKLYRAEELEIVFESFEPVNSNDKDKRAINVSYTEMFPKNGGLERRVFDENFELKTYKKTR